MARPVRNDLSYFTLDCDIFSANSTLKPLIDRYKGDGLSLYIHILCDVYSKGYYFKPDNLDDYYYSLAKDLQMSVAKVQLVIAFMADRTLLDAFSLNKNTVFTSHGMQKRYVEAMKGRKRSVAEIKGEYWILTDEEERKLDAFYKAHPCADKSEKNDDKSEKNDDKSERNALNRTEHIYTTTYVVAGVTATDYAELCNKIGKVTTDYYLERVKAFREKKPQANFSVKSTILKWYREDTSRERQRVNTKTDTSADDLNNAFEQINEEDL